MSVGLTLNTVSQQKENNISRKAYNSTFPYSYTTISCPQNPHILNVQLWIDNAHVFSGCTMNPVAHKGPDILSTLVNNCERCYLSTALWAVSSMRPRGERYIFQYVFYEHWHGINLNTTEQH